MCGVEKCCTAVWCSTHLAINAVPRGRERCDLTYKTDVNIDQQTKQFAWGFYQLDYLDSTGDCQASVFLLGG